MEKESILDAETVICFIVGMSTILSIPLLLLL